MRFRNSSDYFGLVTYAPCQKTPNSATGKAFQAFRMQHRRRASTSFIPRIDSSTRANGSVIVRSKVTNHSYYRQWR
jgi:hypothetical protein